MKFIQGTDRILLGLFPTCLDDSLDFDNETRLIDLFVNSLDLTSLEFEMDFVDNGRPAYHPGDLLRLFIYGYFNRIRSSRALEKECKRNLELIWLLKGLVPDHNTISNFRRDNPAAIKRFFRATVQLAKHFELIGATLIAGDSTKLRAQNSKKNNFNAKKIERHLAYIEEKLAKYQAELAKEDGDEEQKTTLAAEIKKQSARKAKYEALQQQLDSSDQEQISTSDPVSRQLIIRNNITEVAYNVQSTTDAKHHLPIDFKVTNNNDSKAMGNMVRRAKDILGTNQFTALFDKGYHTGSEPKTAFELGIEPIMATTER
jgi:transposase